MGRDCGGPVCCYIPAKRGGEFVVYFYREVLRYFGSSLESMKLKLSGHKVRKKPGSGHTEERPLTPLTNTI